jgi:hypothetical protein
MGVPKFYRWLSERYPMLNHTCSAGNVPIIDNLYLDMNGVIHNCSHGAGTDVNTRMTEDEMVRFPSPIGAKKRRAGKDERSRPRSPTVVAYARRPFRRSRRFGASQRTPR